MWPWRRVQDPAPEAKDPASGMKGRYAPLKRAVLTAMEERKKIHGAGWWNQVADSAGVTHEQIFQAMERRKLPLAVWTALAGALGVDLTEGG